MKQRPNILWLVSDHQVHATRPGESGLFPLQDRLTQAGTMFQRAYSVLPICSPARASMLTGLYPHAHGLTENDGRFGGREGLDPCDWTLNRDLSDAGYRCAWFGKWHVDNQRAAAAYGFEGFSLPGYGYPYGTGEYQAYLRRHNLPQPLARIEMSGESGLSAGTEIRLCEQTQWFDYESGVATTNDPVAVHESYFVADMAREWLRAGGAEPFFLRVDTWGPHPPYLLAAPFLDSLSDRDTSLPDSFHSALEQRPAHHRDYRDYWQQTLNQDAAAWRRYYRHALEHAILVESALVELLDEIDLESTLVIFTSDHGDAAGSSGGVSNKGGLLTEATTRIPLVFAGPGIPAGQSCSRPVSNLDLAPTLLELCAVDVRSGLHGTSLMPLLHGHDGAWRNGLMLQHYGLHLPLTQRAWYEDDFKLVLQSDGFTELYDLARDPGELDNLAGLSEYSGLSQRLRRHLADTMRRFADEDLNPAD